MVRFGRNKIIVGERWGIMECIIVNGTTNRGKIGDDWLLYLLLFT